MQPAMSFHWLQYNKYKVLIEVIRRAYEGGLENAYMEIPPLLSPGPKAETRCCIYKERAIIQDRVLMDSDLSITGRQ